MDKDASLTTRSIKNEIEFEVVKKIIYDIVNTQKYKQRIFLPQDGNEISVSNIIFNFVDYTTDDDINSNAVNLETIFDHNGNHYRYNLGGFIDVNFKLSLGYTSKSDHVRIFYPEYLTHLREYKLKLMGVTIVDKISNRLTEYLGFNSDDIFRCGSLIRIFGGAIRDSIRDDKIYDVDILCGSKSIKKIEELLSNNGYLYMESLTPKDLSAIYSDISVITEPHSWVRGDRIVQLIKPTTGNQLSEKDYKECYNRLIQNVDISCCGVSFDGYNLYENSEDAITHCLKKVYIVNEGAKMYSKRRITHRRAKFDDRGWSEINLSYKPKSEVDAILRDIKLDSVLDNKFEFIKEWVKDDKIELVKHDFPSL